MYRKPPFFQCLQKTQGAFPLPSFYRQLFHMLSLATQLQTSCCFQFQESNKPLDTCEWKCRMRRRRYPMPHHQPIGAARGFLDSEECPAKHPRTQLHSGGCWAICPPWNSLTERTGSSVGCLGSLLPTDQAGSWRCSWTRPPPRPAALPRGSSACQRQWRGASAAATWCTIPKAVRRWSARSCRGTWRQVEGSCPYCLPLPCAQHEQRHHWFNHNALGSPRCLDRPDRVHEDVVRNKGQNILVLCGLLAKDGWVEGIRLWELRLVTSLKPPAHA